MAELAFKIPRHKLMAPIIMAVRDGRHGIQIDARPNDMNMCPTFFEVEHNCAWLVGYPERLTRLFAFAANSDIAGTHDPTPGFHTFSDYIARSRAEYKKLSPTPDGFAAFDKAVETMWATEPNMTAHDLASIPILTWIVDGDHDEVIDRKNTDFMAATIPGARELILPGVSHFAFLQDPAMFNFAVRRFLQERN